MNISFVLQTKNILKHCSINNITHVNDLIEKSEAKITGFAFLRCFFQKEIRKISFKFISITVTILTRTEIV